MVGPLLLCFLLKVCISQMQKQKTKKEVGEQAEEER